MEGVVEVRPRYAEADALPEPILMPAAASKGLFTSVYENKMIVLMIVVAIIVISIVAYVILRKPDDPPKAAARRDDVPAAPPAPDPTVQPPQTAQTVPTVQPAQTVPLVPPVQPVQPSSREDLVNLLAQAKGTPVVPVLPPPPNTKSEEEIMQLMEDETAINDEPAHIAVSCTTVLANGNVCRNKPRNNGKCHVHEG